jgi:hypothetical protein
MKKSYFLLILCLLFLWIKFPAGAQTHDTKQISSEFITLQGNNYPITVEGLPYFAQVFQLDTLCKEKDIMVELLYPEWQPLSREEIRTLAKYDLKVEALNIEHNLSTSRKRSVVEINFSPIAVVNQKLMRLTSAKIQINISTPQQKPSKNNVSTNLSTQRWKDNSVLSQGKWVKIRVEKEGIYQLTSSFLKKNGFNDINKVKLYGYGGRPIEENWTFDSNEGTPDDLLEIPLYRKSDDTALFFAEGTVRFSSNGIHEKNPYSNYSYYFLTEGDNPAIFPSIEATASTDTPINQTPYTVFIDNDKFVWFSGGRELYDDYDFAYNNRRSLSIHTPQPASTDASINIAMSSSSKSSNNVVNVKWGSEDIGKFTINKYGTSQSAYETRKIYYTSKLNTENSIQLTSTQGIPARLNFIRVNYDRLLDASASPYAFSLNKEGNAVLSINNATESTRLWAIGNRVLPCAEIKGTLVEGKFIAPIEDATRRYIFLDISTSYPTPEFVSDVTNQNLHADGPYDMIIIISENKQLQASAERLAEAHRKNQGLRVKVVDAGSLYNEFSSGTPDASAYRRYLKMLYDKAQSDADLPKYLILFGDCAWDNKMQTDEWRGYNPKDFLLAFEVSDGALNKTDGTFPIGELNSYVTDDFYGWLDDSEGNNYALNRLDLAIGRIICLDAETAEKIVDKTIGYLENKNPGAWRNKIFMLADYGNKNLHMNDAMPVVEQIIKNTEDKALVKQIFWDAYERVTTGTGFRFPSVTEKLQRQMKEGALVFNYTGHGSPEQISYAKILTAEDFALPSNNKLPLWIMASCEISPYDTQVNDIGRTALANPNGGAFSIICAARSVYSNYNRELNTTLNKYLFQKGDNGKLLPIGEALRKTKVDMLAGNGVNYNKDGTINKLKYVLLGDPALSLALPTGTVVLDSINGQAITEETQVQIKAGSIARFCGHIVDANGNLNTLYKGLVTGTIEDRMETITCNNYDFADRPITFNERIKTLYEGTDSVRQGKFSLVVRIPRDISYSNEPGRITLYSTGEKGFEDCNGSAECFYFNGSEQGTEADTLAPVIKLYLDSRSFADGGAVSTSPTLIADISDDAGINVGQGSLGNNMELLIDGNNNSPIEMSQYFSFNFGSYNQGEILYPMGDLSSGKHKLSLRVSDINGNTTLSQIDFFIPQKEMTGWEVAATDCPVRTSTRFICTLAEPSETECQITFEVYDLTGRKVWSSEQIPLHTGSIGASCTWHANTTSEGIYLYRAIMEKEGKEKATKAKKIIVIRQ